MSAASCCMVAFCCQKLLCRVRRGGDKAKFAKNAKMHTEKAVELREDGTKMRFRVVLCDVSLCNSKKAWRRSDEGIFGGALLLRTTCAIIASCGARLGKKSIVSRETKRILSKNAQCNLPPRRNTVDFDSYGERQKREMMLSE